MKLNVRRYSFVNLMFLVFIIASCGDKATNAPSAVTAELEPFAKDTLAVRKMLDTNGLTAIAVGEVVTNVMVIDSKTQGAVKRIGELKLQNRHIAIIPSAIGQLTGLTILQLDSNDIAAVPPEIGKCTAITIINLSDNKVASLPPEIGKIDSLKTLILSHNALAALPAQIDSLRALEQLRLDFNMVTALPSITDLSNLRIVYLNNNMITGLPAVMAQSAIQFLTVNNNRLCGLDQTLKTWMAFVAEADWESTQGCQ